MLFNPILKNLTQFLLLLSVFTSSPDFMLYLLLWETLLYDFVVFLFFPSREISPPNLRLLSRGCSSVFEATGWWQRIKCRFRFDAAARKVMRILVEKNNKRTILPWVKSLSFSWEIVAGKRTEQPKWRSTFEWVRKISSSFVCFCRLCSKTFYPLPIVSWIYFGKRPFFLCLIFKLFQKMTPTVQIKDHFFFGSDSFLFFFFVFFVYDNRGWKNEKGGERGEGTSSAYLGNRGGGEQKRLWLKLR